MNGKQDKQKQRTDAPSEKPKIHHRVILMRPHAVCHILYTSAQSLADVEPLLE